MKEVKVGIGDYAVGKGNGIISTYGLGSCVGITLYDRVTKVGGIATRVTPRSC